MLQIHIYRYLFIYTYVYIYICLYVCFTAKITQESSFAGTVATVRDCNFECSVEQLRRFLHYIFFAVSRNGSERSQGVPNYSRFLRAIAWNCRDGSRP